LVSSKKLLLVLGLIVGGARDEASAQLEEVWRLALRPSALGREEGSAIAVDAGGNVYVAASAEQASPDDEAAFVVLKYDSAGALVWARTASLGRVARPAAIAAHPLGGAVIAGEWEDDASDYRFATLRFDADGNELWRAFFGGLDPGNGPESAGAVSLALDPAGNAYVTGWTDTGAELAIQFATVKYGPGGEELWARGFGGPGDDLPSAVAVDSAGRVHVAGTTAGPEDARFSVVRYDSAGGDLGSAHHDEVGQDFARALAVSPRGDAYITGSTSSPGGVEFLTAVLDLGGNLIWSARHGGPSTEGAIDIAVAPDDTSWVLGKVTNVITGTDYRLVRYDVGGNELWDARFETEGDDGARGLAVDDLGNAYVTGTSITPFGSDVVTVAYDPAGDEFWRTSSGGAGDQAAIAIALGSDRGVHIVGSAAGPGVSDVVVFRLDGPDGDERWSDRWQLEGIGAPTDMAVDGGGNIVVTGASSAAGRIDRLTVKFDSGGFVVWEARMPGDEDAGAVSVDAAGNVLLAGRSGLTRLRADGGLAWSIPQGFTHVKLDASGYAHAGGSIAGGAVSDFLTAKYGEEGDEVWAVRFDAAPRDLLSGLGIDSLSNVIVAGESGGAYATVKYDPGGSPVWDRSEPGGTPRALAVGPSGEVAVTGPVTVLYDSAGNRLWASPAIDGVAAAIDVRGGVIVAGLSGGDFATARFEPGGSIDWLTIRGEGSASGVPSEVVLGAAGTVLVSGLVNGAGGRVHALVAYDADGDPAGEALVAPADDAAPPPSLAVDAAGDAYLAGGSAGAYVVARFTIGGEPSFRRAEATGDGALDLTDPVFTLNYLFSGGPAPGCPDAADADGDGELNITDAVFTLGFLFLGTEEPPSPGPFACGADDAADDLGECSYGACP